MTTKVHIALYEDSHAPAIRVYAVARGAHFAQDAQLLAHVERGESTEQFVHYEQDLLVRECFE